MREDSEPEHTTGLLEKNIYPQVFRWKVATIVILGLIAVFLIADIIMLVHLLRNQPRKQNYTFVAQTFSLLPPETPIYTALNPLTALTKSYSQIRYQKAHTVRQWNHSQSALSLNTIADAFFKEDKQLLTWMGIKDDEGRQFTVAAYTNIGFTLPEDDWENYLAVKDNYYFTFEIEDKESALLGTETTGYMKMDGSTESLFECKMLRMSSKDLIYLNAAKIEFSQFEGMTTFTWPGVTAAQAKCFKGEPTTAAIQAQINSMYGITNIIGEYTLTSWQVYHLQK